MFRIRSLLLPLVLAPTMGAGIVTYEGDIFPEKVGWERIAFTNIARSVVKGYFVQFVDETNEIDAYRRPLADFAGANGFFIESRVQTDAPSSILNSSGIPVAVSAGGSAAANYQFVITDMRVSVWRSNFLPIVFVDIDPGVPHTYRLELCGEALCGEERYAWYIDNQLGDSGVAEGRYPNPDSMLVWGARRQMFDATTRWDYIRYGTIPQDASGDYDSDAAVGLDDFYFFHECLSDARPELPGGPGGNSGPGCRFSDFDFDTDTDLRDFAAFQNLFGQLE